MKKCVTQLHFTRLALFNTTGSEMATIISHTECIHGQDGLKNRCDLLMKINCMLTFLVWWKIVFEYFSLLYVVHCWGKMWGCSLFRSLRKWRTWWRITESRKRFYKSCVTMVSITLHFSKTFPWRSSRYTKREKAVKYSFLLPIMVLFWIYLIDADNKRIDIGQFRIWHICK